AGPDEKLSKQGGRQRSACAVQSGLKVGMAIRRQRLQGLQQWRGSHNRWPDDERSGPSETRNRGHYKIGDDVLGPPTEAGAELPIAGTQLDEYERGDGVRNGANINE